MEAHFIAFDRVYTLQGGQMQQLVNRQRTFLKCTGVEDLGGRWLRVTKCKGSKPQRETLKTQRISAWRSLEIILGGHWP